MANRYKPPVPLRSVKIEDEIWRPAMQKATESGQSLSDVIRDALKRYVEDKS